MSFWDSDSGNGASGLMICLTLVAGALVASCSKASEQTKHSSGASASQHSESPNKSGAATSLSQQPSSGATQDPTKTLRVIGSPEQHDFGTIADLEHVSFNYKVVNTSDQTIELTSIKSPCGCARGKAVPSTLGPGATGEIQASFYPQGRQGPQLKVLTVSTNRAGETPLELPLMCNILPTVLLKPRNVAFQRIQRGEASKTELLTVTVRAAGKKITNITSRDDRFVITAKSKEQITEGDEAFDRYQYEVRFTGAPSAGRYRGYILIETDVPTHPKLQVSTYATVIGPVSVAPDQVGIGRLTPGSSFERIIRVSHREAKALQVEQAWFEGPAHVEASIKMLAPDPRMKGVTQLKLSGRVNSPPGANAKSISRIGGEVIIKTSLPEQPEVRARINGWVVPHP